MMLSSSPCFLGLKKIIKQIVSVHSKCNMPRMLRKHKKRASDAIKESKGRFPRTNDV